MRSRITLALALAAFTAACTDRQETASADPREIDRAVEQAELQKQAAQGGADAVKGN